MMTDAMYASRLADFATEGRFRRIPGETGNGVVDFTSNDYLGLAATPDGRLYESGRLTSSASRLLSRSQKDFAALEGELETLYRRPALLFNSGYHVNTGCIPSLGGGNTLFIADKLVHASMIDGLVLSRNRFLRFPHNDFGALRRIVEKNIDGFDRLVILTESIFSMDGDIAPLAEIAALRDRYEGRVLTYVDEAHAIGVRGPRGLGLTEELGLTDRTDVIVGTFGKALASYGAFVIVSAILRDWLVNTARSFIFSTALPPVCAIRSLMMLREAVAGLPLRARLRSNSEYFRERLASVTGLTSVSQSQIVPWIIGDSNEAARYASQLGEAGYGVLPIRRPTVPAGTERIRFSLSAAHTRAQIDGLLSAITSIVSA